MPAVTVWTKKEGGGLEKGSGTVELAEADKTANELPALHKEEGPDSAMARLADFDLHMEDIGKHDWLNRNLGL
eukprot:SAG22_NODE_901_length_6600_cov_1.945854_5_plen_73_part_00